MNLGVSSMNLGVSSMNLGVSSMNLGVIYNYKLCLHWVSATDICTVSSE